MIHANKLKTEVQRNIIKSQIWNHVISYRILIIQDISI